MCKIREIIEDKDWQWLSKPPKDIQYNAPSESLAEDQKRAKILKKLCEDSFEQSVHSRIHFL